MDNEIKYLKKKLFIAKIYVILAKMLYVVSSLLIAILIVSTFATIILFVRSIFGQSYLIMALKMAAIAIVSYSLERLVQLFARHQLKKLNDLRP